MSTTPEPGYREELHRLAASAPAQRSELERLHGLLPLQAEGLIIAHAFDGWAMVPVVGVPGMEGAELAVLPSPPGQSITLLRCPFGAYGKEMSVPQAVRVLMVRGAFTWWQESLVAPIRLEAGQEVSLAPGEKHSFTALSDETLNYNFFTPSL
jgi:quercetin dioxygenase-like cupin family protein